MKYQIRLSGDRGGLSREIKVRSGVDLAKCYQCGECTAGCPMTTEMDAGPTKTMRFIQLGMEDALFSLNTPWFCASCETCTARCPNEIDVALVMDTVRQIARLKGKTLPVKDPAIFQDVFLGSVENHGRLYEPGMIASYKMKSLHLLQDVTLAPKMLVKGKLPLLPHNSKNREKLREIFQKAREYERAKGEEVAKAGEDHSEH